MESVNCPPAVGLSHANHEATTGCLLAGWGRGYTRTAEGARPATWARLSLAFFSGANKSLTRHTGTLPRTVPHGHSTSDEGLCSSPRMGASVKPALKFKAVKQSLSCYQLLGYRGKGPALILGPNCFYGTNSSSAHEQGPDVASLFLAGLALPLVQPGCVHCMGKKPHSQTDQKMVQWCPLLFTCLTA